MAKQSRRPVGASTVFKRTRRGRETWVGELTVGYDEETGKRRVRTFYAAKKREVRERLAEATTQQSKGVDLLQGKQTVADYLEEWFTATAEEKGWKARTRADYRALLDKHILPQLGHLALSDLLMAPGALLAPPDNYLPDRAAYAELLARCGFEDVVVVDVTRETWRAFRRSFTQFVLASASRYASPLGVRDLLAANVALSYSIRGSLLVVGRKPG